jgi:hypothetical protein
MATTRIRLKDATSGNLPRICVKTGHPADVLGQFRYDPPGSGTWGFIGFLFLVFPVVLVLIVPVAVVAYVARRARGSLQLPMTRVARRRRRIGPWIGPLALLTVTGMLTTLAWLYPSLLSKDA